MASEQSAKLLDTDEVIPFTVRVHFDFESCSKFVSVYIPADLNPVSITQYFINDITKALDIAKNVEFASGFYGLDDKTNSEDLLFTGRLFVYTDTDIPQELISGLRDDSKTKGIKLDVRSIAYRDARNHFERPLAFISHDSRDKKDVAEPIAMGLQKLMCPVWYDEFSLNVGDSLRESIEHGIKESKTCIVVLSPNFFANTGWTKKEFNSIFSKEIVEGKNVILPVWHKVSRQEVYDYSPNLADRKGISTDLGIDEVVKRLHCSIGVL